MPAQHSAGAIIFRREGKRVFYLLLNYHPGYWGLAKGAIEKGETVTETAKREIQEETGLTDIEFLDGFKVNEKYFFTDKGEKIFKTVTFLLAETKTEAVKISWEHIGYVWLPFEEAEQRLTYPKEKEFMKQANEFILSQK